MTAVPFVPGVLALAIFVVVLFISGCARLGTPPSSAPSQSNAPRPVIATQSRSAAVGPATSPTAPPAVASTGQTAGKTAPPVTKAPAKSPAPPSKQEGSAPGVAVPKAPPLDLASLEQRLKDTKAIGILTKITIKNQVDDLLNQFRAFYQGKLKTDLANLRRSYDLLVLKVLSLLQDGDPSLATAIAGSREAIWGILSDPTKFANI